MAARERLQSCLHAADEPIDDEQDRFYSFAEIADIFSQVLDCSKTRVGHMCAGQQLLHMYKLHISMSASPSNGRRNT